MTLLPKDPDLRQLLFGGMFFAVVIVLLILLFTLPRNFTPNREGMMSSASFHPDPWHATSVNSVTHSVYS